MFCRKNTTFEEIKEMQSLLDHLASLRNDLIRNQVRRLLQHSKPDEVSDLLMSRGSLTGDECNRLSSEYHNQETFLESLILMINTRTKLNSLLATVIECDPDFRPVDSAVVRFIQQNIPSLIECLDVDNGLADCLFSNGVLTSEQYERLTNKSWWSSFQEQNRELLSNMLPSRLVSMHMYKMFLAALVETDQGHVCNFINNSVDSVQFNGDDCRILTMEALNRIDNNLFHMIKLIDPHPIFLESLVQEGCITERHKERIDVRQTKSDKNKELLTIIRRRSYEDFKTFKRVLQTTQKGGIIAKLLGHEFDHVTRVHCEISVDPKPIMSPELLAQRERNLYLMQSLPQEVTYPHEYAAEPCRRRS